MVKYFDDMGDPKASWRAVQIWQILVGCAANWQITTYGHLADCLGYEGSGIFKDILDRIYWYCKLEGLPSLTSIVVNKNTGIPGAGFFDNEDKVDLNAAHVNVFKHEWYKLIPPSAEEFQHAWDSRPTSNK